MRQSSFNPLWVRYIVASKRALEELAAFESFNPLWVRYIVASVNRHNYHRCYRGNLCVVCTVYTL